MIGEKLPRKIDDSGYYIFNFNVGAVYKIKVTYKNQTVANDVYKILSAELCGDTEYYTFKNGEGKIKCSQSANRLHFLLKFGEAIELEAGTPQPLPLLPHEVTLFYSALTTRHNKEVAAAKKIIKTDAELKKIAERIALIPAECGAAARKGEAELDKLLTERKQLFAKLYSALKEKGINLAYYSPPLKCRQCNNTGLTVTSGICQCALKRVKEIQDFCAAERLKEKFKNL